MISQKKPFHLSHDSDPPTPGNALATKTDRRRRTGLAPDERSDPKESCRYIEHLDKNAASL